MTALLSVRSFNLPHLIIKRARELALFFCGIIHSLNYYNNMKHYADGKKRESLTQVKKLEKIYGIDQLSPFGTNHTKVFEEIVEKDVGDETDSPFVKQEKKILSLNGFARKVGAHVSADLQEQKKFLWEAFRAWQTQNPPIYANDSSKQLKPDMRKNKSKELLKQLDKTRTKSVFEKEFPKDNPESFAKLLNTFTLADLQNLAAKAGFNPSFDKAKAKNILVKAFSSDWKNRQLLH